jgi:arylsulfatase A-like enzyme
LDKGKINAKEGGTRVPLIISGPGIKPGQESDVMINGVDFYPTILSWTGSKYSDKQDLDGVDLSTLLVTNPADENLLVDKTGKVRNTMIHHYPHRGL